MYYQMVACAIRLVTVHPAYLGCLTRKKSASCYAGYERAKEYCCRPKVCEVGYYNDLRLTSEINCSLGLYFFLPISYSVACLIYGIYLVT